MRLTPIQRETILRVVGEIAGPGARVRLFGSRVDDNKRGGDIDLMVELDAPVENRLSLELAISTQLYRAMHERKVDVLLVAPNVQQQPIHKVAFETGILL